MGISDKAFLFLQSQNFLCYDDVWNIAISSRT